MTNRNRELANHFDTDNRINQLQEECAELICIANHYRRGRCGKDSVAKEMADVKVTMEQAAYKLGITEKMINEIADMKIGRALERREWEK